MLLLEHNSYRLEEEEEERRGVVHVDFPWEVFVFGVPATRRKDTHTHTYEMKMDPAFTDEFVIVRRGKHEGDPSEITVNCPDKVGLGCDFARTVFEFGLSVVKGGEFSHSFFMDETFYGDLFTKSCHLWKIYNFCGGNRIIECHVWSISLCHGFGPTHHFFLLQGLP